MERERQATGCSLRKSERRTFHANARGRPGVLKRCECLAHDRSEIRGAIRRLHDDLANGQQCLEPRDEIGQKLIDGGFIPWSRIACKTFDYRQQVFCPMLQLGLKESI